MKSKNGFIVRIPKKFKDTVTVAGVELYLDPKFREFENRVCGAEIVATPIGCNGEAAVGDVLYFHHHVVINRNFSLGDELYLVINEHAYAFSKGEEVSLIDDWVMLHAVDASGIEEKNGVIIHKKSDDHGNVGVIAFDSPVLQQLGLKAGDRVGFTKNSDYTMEILGKNYWRMRADDITYKEVK